MRPNLLRTHLLRPAVLALAAGTLLAGCATRLDQAVTGYTCCNLRPDRGWISSNNVQGGAMLPAGAPAQLDSIKRSYYVYGTVGGQAMALRDDAARSREDTLEWVRRVIVPQDPRRELAGWSPDVQAAVRDGKVRIGMTRAQALMSLGYPSRNDTPDLKAGAWRYWTALGDKPVDVVFNAAGAVTEVRGDPLAAASLLAGR